MQILSYNIHKGFSLSQRFVLEPIREIIQSTEADIVFLQEVLGQNKKLSLKYKNWPLKSQLEYLADSLWPHHVYGKNALYEHGHHGNAILSKYPITEFENIDISNNRFERRGLLHVVISTPQYPRLHLICVHLDLLESGRKIQTNRIVEHIQKKIPVEEPLILAGDFNDWNKKVSKTLFDELGLYEVFQFLYGKPALSFPSIFPLLPLDRIYTRDLVPSKAHCLTHHPWSGLSDHGALIAEFDDKC